MKRVLVYACGGYLGTAICLQLKNDGHYVVGMDLLDGPRIPENVDVYHIIRRDMTDTYNMILDDSDIDIIIDCSSEQLPRNNGYIIPVSFLIKRQLDTISESKRKPHYVFLSGDDAVDTNANEKLLAEKYISYFSKNDGIKSTILRLGEVRGVVFSQLGELVEGELKPNTLNIYDVMSLVSSVVDTPQEGLFHTVDADVNATKVCFSWSPVNTYHNNNTIN